MAKQITLEAVPENLKDIPKEIAVEVNKYAANNIQATTRTKIQALLKDHAGTDKKIVKDAVDAEANASLKQLAQEVLKQPEKLTPDERNEVHKNILEKMKTEYGKEKNEVSLKDDIEGYKKTMLPPEPKPEPKPDPIKPDDDKPSDGDSTTADTVKNVGKAGILAAAGYGLWGALSHPAGYATGAAEGLKLMGSHVANAGSWLWGGLNTFTAKMGMTLGPKATTPWLSFAPASASWLMPAAVGVGAGILGGHLIRGIRKYAFGRKDLPKIGANAKGWMGLKKLGAQIVSPITQTVGLLGDIKNTITGAGKEGKGMAGKIWNYTGKPVAEHTIRAIKPRSWGLGAAVAGGILFPPLGIPAGYLLGNYLKNSDFKLPEAKETAEPAEKHEDKPA